jgi:hypothetical protein
MDFSEPITFKVGDRTFSLDPEEHSLMKGIAYPTSRSFAFLRHEQTDQRLPNDLEAMFAGNCLCRKPDLKIPQVAELVFEH